ncbi:MAG: NTP transferase domain-containing protein [Alteraurantiacibacter sp.]
MADAGPLADTGPLVAVLAAGAASRFGGGKLDADLAGKPVGQWVVDAVAAAGLAPGLIVVSPQVTRFAAASGWPLLTNIRPSDGLGTSLALAASAALGQGRALLVVLADMPLVSPRHLAELAANRCAATLYPDGKAGVPALVDLAMLPALAELTGGEGAGPLLAARSDLVRVPAPPAMLLDIDRPADLARAAELAAPTPQGNYRGV